MPVMPCPAVLNQPCNPLDYSNIKKFRRRMMGGTGWVVQESR